MYSRIEGKIVAQPPNAKRIRATTRRALAHLVQHRGDIRRTAKPRGFEHGDGWFDILWRLCEDLEPLVAEFEVAGGLKFEVLQVKENLATCAFT
jgi:hypothetical protein